MAPTTTAPIKNGIVRRIRSSSDIKAAINGGIHEREAPRRVRYPFIVFSEVAAPQNTAWGNNGGTIEIHAVYDISAIALEKAEAQNLDSLLNRLFGALDSDVQLDDLVVGQHVTLCQRVSTMPTGPDRDDEGRRIVQFGGTYEIWTTQPFSDPPSPPGP
jgi:hypothetical protein